MDYTLDVENRIMFISNTLSNLDDQIITKYKNK